MPRHMDAEHKTRKTRKEEANLLLAECRVEDANLLLATRSIEEANLLLAKRSLEEASHGHTPVQEPSARETL